MTGLVPADFPVFCSDTFSPRTSATTPLLFLNRSVRALYCRNFLENKQLLHEEPILRFRNDPLQTLALRTGSPRQPPRTSSFSHFRTTRQFHPRDTAPETLSENAQLVIQ